MVRIIARNLIILFAIGCSTMQAAKVLKGDSAAAAGESFSFAVQAHAQSPEYPLNTQPTAVLLIGLNFYVAAAPGTGGADIVKNFSVSRVTRGSDQFLPFTPKEVKFNNFNSEKDLVANPLYDQGISFLGIFDGTQTVYGGTTLLGAPERPVTVLSNDLTTIYVINSFRGDGSDMQVFSVLNPTLAPVTKNIPDANGLVTSGMRGLSVDAPQILAVVAPNAGAFGDPGTGLAIAQVGTVDAKKFTGVLVVDGPTYVLVREGGNRAVAFDVTSDFIKINSDAASMEDAADIVFHRSTRRWYIALQPTAGAAGTDGVRGIIVGRVVYATENGIVEGREVKTGQAIGFAFAPIAPADAFDLAGDKIVGAIGSSAQVSIHKVQPMYTSTSISYLIVQGNAGAPDDTKKVVFALPLVDGNSDPALNGTIASKNAIPEAIYNAKEEFITNNVTVPATTPADMPLSTDAATQVGAGELPNGDIVDMYVRGDAVFVSVQTPDGNQIPGLFYSQSIFDEHGQITHWTKWVRVTGTTNKCSAIGLDPNTADFYFSVANNANEVKTVKRTEWGTGETLQPLTNVVENLFPESNGGVQGLFDFVISSTTNGTETPGLLDISLLIATGNNAIMLAETSRDVAGIIMPTTSFGTIEKFINSTIDKTFPVGDSKIITIEGGTLSELGPLSAAEIARDGVLGSNGYLFVGGTKGVAVLSNADGTGWDTSLGLGIGFEGLVTGMTFKKVGNYKFVQKLLYSDGFLYVLTRTQLDRIDLTTLNVGLGEINPITLAKNDLMSLVGPNGSFLDFIISEKLVLLATSKGLLRNQFNVKTASDTATMGWLQVPTPEGIGSVQKLFAITPTLRAQDVSSNDPGYVNALSAFAGKDQAYVFRYTIESTVAGDITATTVQEFPDMFVKNRPSYFVGFGQYRSSYNTDGSLYFGTSNKTQTSGPVVVTLDSTLGIYTGSRLPTTITMPTGVQGSIISAFFRNIASGSWIIAGNAGLRINE